LIAINALAHGFAKVSLVASNPMARLAQVGLPNVCPGNVSKAFAAMPNATVFARAVGCKATKALAAIYLKARPI